MIWFGNLERFFVGDVPAGLPRTAEFTRMQMGLERVAEIAPALSGRSLLEAVVATGWVDRETAERLLPHFRHFDADAHFATYLRRLSFQGRSAEDQFRMGVRCIVEEITGNARIGGVGPESGIRFATGNREGIVLPHPEVGFTISGKTRDAIAAAVEEMPDTIVVIARSFEKNTAAQLRSILAGTEVTGTLVTLNLLLGIRATTLRYQPRTDRVIELLSTGGAIRSPQIAKLAERNAG